MFLVYYGNLTDMIACRRQSVKCEYFGYFLTKVVGLWLYMQLQRPCGALGTPPPPPFTPKSVYDKSNKTYVSKSAQNGKIATFDAEL
jgi:hypothetical protein|tara:strand:- start:182 stop:442 length:261 start_codon:yes stop_codon:yes gene_type:complete